MAQNEKYLKRMNSGKELITQIISYMIDSTYQFEMLFKELLESDQNEGDDGQKRTRTLDYQVS